MTGAIVMRHTGIASPLCEPAERDDPVNGLLDSLETLVRTLVEMGHEAPLRARMQRLLPIATPPLAASPGGASRLASGDPAGTRVASGDIDRAIGLANAAAFCERAGRAARGEASRLAAEAHASFLRSEIESLRARSDSRSESRPDRAGHQDGETSPLAAHPAGCALAESDAQRKAP